MPLVLDARGVSRATPPSTEQSIAVAYGNLTTNKEKVDFLSAVVKNLSDRIRPILQNARASAPTVSGQYEWAQGQSPPIDLDVVGPSQPELAGWERTLSGATVPPRSLVESVEASRLDRLVESAGLKLEDVLPGPSEPRGARRRKTRKGKSRRRSTRRRRS